MIPLLIVILWLVFGVIAASALLYRQYCYHQLLGITLSRTHAQHPDVRETIVSFTKICYWILLLSLLCSLLLLIPFFKAYAEFAMLLLVAANLFANWFVIHYHQKKLIHIKAENNWIYPQAESATVDIAVSTEKGSSGISPVWVWLFFLISFTPTAVLLMRPDLQPLYPLGVSIIGPLCQLCTIFPFYQMQSRHSRIVHGRSEANTMFVQDEKRINAISATFSSLAMMIFWLLFSFSLIIDPDGLLLIAPVVLLTVTLLVIAGWHQNRIQRLEETVFSTISGEEEYIVEQDAVWKWGFYNNPSDPHLLVPKRIASMGWTINMGRPVGKLFLLLILILTVGVIGLAAYGGIKDYQISVQGSEVIIDAAMYDKTIEKDQILSVSIIDQLPTGRRTNGYNGAEKSYGHYFIEGYGKCMLYVYKDVNEYIVIQLAGDSGYVILNEKTAGETEALCQEINRWLSE